MESSKEKSESPVSTKRQYGVQKPVITMAHLSNKKIEQEIRNEQDPRILDLRQKLNEITRKKEIVDKETKSIINDITQKLTDERNLDDSGPYSLLFDLQQIPTTSKSSISQDKQSDIWDVCTDKNINISDIVTECHNVSQYQSDEKVDRLPNIIYFEDKPLKEFEYSCEISDIDKAATFRKPYNSRSELCLHFKPQLQNRPIDILSPSDSSIQKTNEENSLDDSLGILTPDQMDDICYLENAFSPTVEDLPHFPISNYESKISPENGDTPSTDKTESNSAPSAMFMQNDEYETSRKIIQVDENSVVPTICLQELAEISQKTHCLFQDSDVNMISSDQDKFVNTNYNTSLSKNRFGTNYELSSLTEEELLPSIQSSILEPLSSVTDTTVNLDLPLDCKHNDNRLSTHRIEQTPSPEDLPLDNSEVNGELSTYSNSQFSTSTLHDTHTFSDHKHEFPKSMESSKVSNSFITSVTSITSLDGYQGDGEMSRPVSRSADHSIGNREDVMEMDWQNIPVTRRTDPMTDSDFFTESDADGLDDHMHRGDRRAQVIDGALYGGNNNNGNPPLIVNRSEDSCMESSGVYTDLENQRSSPVLLNAIDDISPDGSSPSTHSECSQKNGTLNKESPLISVFDKTLEPINESRLSSLLIEFEDDHITPKAEIKRKSIINNKDHKSNEKVNKEDKRNFALKKYKMPKRDVPSKLKTMLAARKTDADSSVQNIPKLVKKNDRHDIYQKKSIASDNKNVYKAKSFKDIKSKVDSSFSLQRSQTACSVTRMLSSKSANQNSKPKTRHMRIRMDMGSSNGSGKSSLHSSQSDLSASSTPLSKHPSGRFPLIRTAKKRENTPTSAQPIRPPSTPPAQPTPPIVKKNGVVQKLASSPVAVRARTSIAPPLSPRKPTPRRLLPQRPTTLTNLPNKEPVRVAAAVGPRGKRPGPQTPTGPPARASPVTNLTPPSLPVPAPQAAEQAAALAHAAKGVEALGVLVQYLVFRLDALNSGAWRSEATRWRSMAAAERTGAARAELEHKQRAQKDLDTIAECLNKISELEMEVSAKEEANTRLQIASAKAEAKYRATVEEISQLADDIKGLKGTIESLKYEVAESRKRLFAQGEKERVLRVQLDAAKRELARSHEVIKCEKPKNNQLQNNITETETAEKYDSSRDIVKYNGYCEAQVQNGNKCDFNLTELCELEINTNSEVSNDPSELAAEVRSLRAVLELKQAEAATLRSAQTELSAEREVRTNLEREARTARHAAEELRERAAARQRDVDRLKDDNRRLREAAARDRDHAARLSALNEELRYKLRQKSQVVSLLAGGGYLERTLRTRTASGDSARSPSPPPDSPPSPVSSPAPSSDSPPLPAVKGVVEKHDSVSWVLEIEETPEEVASRLARRSSFRTQSGSSPGGVKRRGGGSPGNGSPAPASPAPNASKLFRPGDLDFSAPTSLKESAGEVIYVYEDRQF